MHYVSADDGALSLSLSPSLFLSLSLSLSFSIRNGTNHTDRGRFRSSCRYLRTRLQTEANVSSFGRFEAEVTGQYACRGLGLYLMH